MASYTQTRWSLQDLLPEPDGPALQAYLDELEDLILKMESARSDLRPAISAEEFNHLLDLFEAQSHITSRLGAYTSLWFYEDTKNPAALNLRGRIDQTLAQVSNRVLFLSLWFKDLPDEQANRLILSSGDRKYMLECMRRFKPHTLSEPEERVITLKDVDGIEALVEMYELITSALVFHLEMDGEMLELTRDQLSAYFRSPSAQLRHAAYEEFLSVFERQKELLSQIYIHRVRDWHTEGIELRKFAEPISYRNLNNDIPDDVVDALLESCRANAQVFQRFFRLKAGWLGVEKLHRFDIYTPLASSEATYDFEKAAELVLQSFGDLSPEAAELVERVFNQNHLDSENRPGKRGGAFCFAALPELTPWVLVNYAGRARDVATLAHELGHALHGMQAAGQSVLNFWPPQPLSETASIFSEMLLTERLLSSASDPALRRELLAHSIDDAFASVLRQAYFTIFERQAHKLVCEGGSVEDLCSTYYEGLLEQFGDSVELVDGFRWEWIAIPHLTRTPFYTYAYSFGQLLVLALYQQFKTEGAAFVPRYLKILSYGGAAAPAEILAEAGVDITKAAFWQGGFDVLDGMISQLEEM